MKKTFEMVNGNFLTKKQHLSTSTHPVGFYKILVGIFIYKKF